MSDNLFNIRIWHWHLQLSRSGKFRLVRNTWHRDHDWPDGYFAVYDFWPFR